MSRGSGLLKLFGAPEESVRHQVGVDRASRGRTEPSIADGVAVSGSFPAGEDVTLTHNLSRTPTGAILIDKSAVSDWILVSKNVRNVVIQFDTTTNATFWVF